MRDDGRINLDFSHTDSWYAICEDWGASPRRFFSVLQAKELYRKGMVGAVSADMHSLANEFDFDLEKYWEYYEVPKEKRFFRDEIK